MFYFISNDYAIHYSLTVLISRSFLCKTSKNEQLQLQLHVIRKRMFRMVHWSRVCSWTCSCSRSRSRCLRRFPASLLSIVGVVVVVVAVAVSPVARHALEVSVAYFLWHAYILGQMYVHSLAHAIWLNDLARVFYFRRFYLILKFEGVISSVFVA